MLGRVVRLALVLALGSSAASAETRRIAIVVGNNAGAGNLPPLRYAESDAGKMARVLVELGDVSPDDLMLLQGRPMAELERAIADARERVASLERSPDVRTVLLFYFSGHSDGESIELGREKLPYARLKALLQGTGADVRVAIVDACKSGSALREKGGRPAQPFTIKLTDQLNASGEAFITSSAADEAALESAEVMGSFFTHNLISGLRGAADASGDRLVTLAEAYRYAYDRTVSATALMPVGAQHPSYDYRLSGQGELVLAMLQKPSAALVLPDGAERSLVSDLQRDQVLVELPAHASREVALAPGIYGVRLFKGGQSFGGRFHLQHGVRKVVRWDELTPLSASLVVAAKGGEVRQQVNSSPAFGSARLYSLSAGAGRSVAAGAGLYALARLSFEPQEGSGWSAAALGATASAGDFAERSAQLRGGWRWVWRQGAVALSGGADAAVGYFSQSAPTGEASTVAFGLGPHGSARLSLSGPVWLVAQLDAPVFLMRVDERLQTVALPSGSAGVAVAF